jgi:hypothetical protein
MSGRDLPAELRQKREAIARNKIFHQELVAQLSEIIQQQMDLQAKPETEAIRAELRSLGSKRFDLEQKITKVWTEIQNDEDLCKLWEEEIARFDSLNQQR